MATKVKRTIPFHNRRRYSQEFKDQVVAHVKAFMDGGADQFMASRMAAQKHKIPPTNALSWSRGRGYKPSPNGTNGTNGVHEGDHKVMTPSGVITEEHSYLLSFFKADTKTYDVIGYTNLEDAKAQYEVVLNNSNCTKLRLWEEKKVKVKFSIEIEVE